MNNQTLYIGVATLCIGGVLGYLAGQHAGGCSMMKKHHHNDTPSGVHRMPDGSLMHNGHTTAAADMTGKMDHSMMMVTSEQEFITEMIPHHQEAVDTAREVLARGATTPEIKALMEAIIAAQEKEIADLKAWHQAWYDTAYQPSGTYRPMMRDLSMLSGAALDAVFLEDMVMHHMGAIMMAESVQPYIEHEEIRTLAEAIISSQTAEIELMKRLRADV